MQMPVRPERQFPGVQTALHLAEALLEAKHEYGYILPPAERCALHGIITVASHTAAHQMAGRYTPAIFHDRLAAIREKLDRNAVQAGLRGLHCPQRRRWHHRGENLSSAAR